MCAWSKSVRAMGCRTKPNRSAWPTRCNWWTPSAPAGLSYIEVGSFVSPKWVPQMAGSAEVFAQIQRKPGVTYGALAPNLRGFEAALAAGVKEVAVFAAASEAFSQTQHQLLDQRKPGNALRRSWRQPNNTALACAATCPACCGCPYEGDGRARASRRSGARELYAMGCYEVSLGDTIGTGTAGATRRAVRGRSVRRCHGTNWPGHFHDTYGQAVANIYASLLEGISVFDSSIAGLGGCPYAKGASGNVATEDVVYLLNGLGIDTGIDLDALDRRRPADQRSAGPPSGFAGGQVRSARS